MQGFARLVVCLAMMAMRYFLYLFFFFSFTYSVCASLDSFQQLMGMKICDCTKFYPFTMLLVLL